MWGWILFWFIVFILIVRIKKRGYFWKDRKGKKIGAKEFFSRWKKGIDGITNVQQTQTAIMGTWIVITGILTGIIVVALVRIPNIWWWTEIILISSLIITTIQLIGTLQKHWRFKEVEERTNQALGIKKKKKKPKKLKDVFKKKKTKKAKTSSRRKRG